MPTHQPVNLPSNQPTHQQTRKLIFIVGPTTTGKSALAFQLAEQFPANILVADSRQVYKEIPITSGADIPINFSLTSDPELPHPFFIHNHTELHGTSFLAADKPWSVGAFYQLAHQVLDRTLSQKKVLIIVGGTGLYTHSLLFPVNQMLQQPSNQLRQQLQGLSLTELQQKLIQIDAVAETKFNHSDWNNPRRLIRAIEIASESSTQPININTLDNVLHVELHNEEKTIVPTWIGVDIEKDTLTERIQHRVQKRFQQGAIAEVEELLARYENQSIPAFSATGVKEIIGLLTDQYTQKECEELWTRREVQYAKRQLTWFKKRSYIHWHRLPSPLPEDFDSEKLLAEIEL